MDDNPEPLPWETEAYKKLYPLPGELKRHTVKELQAKLLEWAKEDKEKTKELTDLFT